MENPREPGERIRVPGEELSAIDDVRRDGGAARTDYDAEGEIREQQDGIPGKQGCEHADGVVAQTEVEGVADLIVEQVVGGPIADGDISGPGSVAEVGKRGWNCGGDDK